MSHPRRPLRTVLTIASAALVLTSLGCTTSQTPNGSGSTSAAEPRTLSVGISGKLQQAGWSPDTQPVFQNYPAEAVWDQIIRLDKFGKPLPGAAESFEFSKDNKSVTFHLRKGMKFSDGTAVDSAAVQTAFEYQQKVNEGRFPKDMTFATPDAQTITATWPAPVPTLPLVVRDIRMECPAWLKAGVFDTPCGYGGYTLDKANSITDSVLTFTKNPSYWDAANVPFDTLVVKAFDSDTAVLNALKTKQIDGALLGPSTIDEVDKAGLKGYPLSGETLRMILSDHSGKVVPALGSLKVRQAMNMVFDKQAMVTKLYAGHGTPATQIFREGSDAWIPNLKDPYPYDVEKAKALMKEAGYENGFEMTVATIDGIGAETWLPYITQQLGELKITVKEKRLTGPNAILDLLCLKTDDKKYPTPVWQLGNFGESMQDMKDYVLPEGTWNIAKQKDPKIDALWAQIVAGTGDRAALEKEMNQYTIDNAWNIPFLNPQRVFAYNPAALAVPAITTPDGTFPSIWDFKAAAK